jgi:hypothetical protein
MSVFTSNFQSEGMKVGSDGEEERREKGNNKISCKSK